MDGGTNQKLDGDAFLVYLTHNRFQNAETIYVLCGKACKLYVNDVRATCPAMKTLKMTSGCGGIAALFWYKRVLFICNVIACTNTTSPIDTEWCGLNGIGTINIKRCSSVKFWIKNQLENNQGSRLIFT
jgi:hypothetical protein